jgi:hypothetical protein
MSGQPEIYYSGQKKRNNLLLMWMLIVLGLVWILMALLDDWRRPFGWEHPSIKFLFGLFLLFVCAVYQRIKQTSRFRRHIVIENQGLRLKLHPLKSETWIPWEHIVAIDCRMPEPRLRLAGQPGFLALGEDFAFEMRKALRERLQQVAPEKCISSHT